MLHLPPRKPFPCTRQGPPANTNLNDIHNNSTNSTVLIFRPFVNRCYYRLTLSGGRTRVTPVCFKRTPVIPASCRRMHPTMQWLQPTFKRCPGNQDVGQILKSAANRTYVQYMRIFLTSSAPHPSYNQSDVVSTIKCCITVFNIIYKI